MGVSSLQSLSWRSSWSHRSPGPNRGPYRRSSQVCGDDGQAQQENQRLRDEVSQLKERLKVLERITVDKENSLAREIESLRDR